MFLVPTDTPGVEIVRNVGLYGEPNNAGLHALVRYDNVRVPTQALLGGKGQAFVIAPTAWAAGGFITPCARSACPALPWT